MPAEHGAWGMWAVPFLCAAFVAGGWNLPLLLTGLAALALFLWRGSIAAHGDWKTWNLPAHLGLAGGAALAGGVVVLFYGRYELLWLGVGGAVLFGVQEWLAGRHREHASEKRSLAEELAGVLLLSFTAPAAWIAARGHLTREGVEVWLLSALFFLGGVLYVKYRVRGLLAHRAFPGLRERFLFAWPVFLYHFLLMAFLACWMLLETSQSFRMAALGIAFAPGVLRAYGLLFQLGKRFPIRRLGWSEVIQSVVFATLLILAFRIVA